MKPGQQKQVYTRAHEVVIVWLINEKMQWSDRRHMVEESCQAFIIEKNALR